MARFFSAALSSLCFLVVPRIRALKAAPADSSDLDCTCLNWADVYRNRGVFCGQGMELYSVLTASNVSMPEDPRSALSLARMETVSPAFQAQLVKSMAYFELCTTFFQRANFNYCVNKHFNAGTEQLKHSASRGSWCYVDARCKLPGVAPIRGTGVAAKSCTAGGLDFPLADVPIGLTAELGRLQGLDPNFIAGHANAHLDMTVGEVTQPMLEAIQASGQSTFVWSNRDPLAPRMIVRGKEVWGHMFNATSIEWTADCLRNCK
eukprot:CAMPEP_0204572204 /NCGR_PEP_ID=MMETSP0661-20131031/39331_1 /ASSEMBLY_ACC=CAM_ASM_000606 /TAXON_ID=109239 /ORGANISM="Alexandrium margalefi, Strain AMGDE01CS-322" /LENGTH=262 /DNA_ID=CAMNT_0051580543 /DNA_START=59 /DNA_END=844 /DNA_ORIENTATION=-